MSIVSELFMNIRIARTKNLLQRVETELENEKTYQRDLVSDEMENETNQHEEDLLKMLGWTADPDKEYEILREKLLKAQVELKKYTDLKKQQKKQKKQESKKKSRFEIQTEENLKRYDVKLIDYIWRDRKRSGFLALAFPWGTPRYRLTKDRLFTSTGFLSVQEDELELHRIKDFQIHMTLGQRICRTGDIKIFCPDDATDPETDLYNVKYPREVKELIHKYSEEQKQLHKKADKPDDAVSPSPAAGEYHVKLTGEIRAAAAPENTSGPATENTADPPAENTADPETEKASDPAEESVSGTA